MSIINTILPKELLLMTFSNLQEEDLSVVRLVCKYWNEVSGSNDLWQGFLRCRFIRSIENGSDRTQLLNIFRTFCMLWARDSGKPEGFKKSQSLFQAANTIISTIDPNAIAKICDDFKGYNTFLALQPCVFSNVSYGLKKILIWVLVNPSQDHLKAQIEKIIFLKTYLQEIKHLRRYEKIVSLLLNKVEHLDHLEMTLRYFIAELDSARQRDRPPYVKKYIIKFFLKHLKKYDQQDDRGWAKKVKHLINFIDSSLNLYLTTTSFFDQRMQNNAPKIKNLLVEKITESCEKVSFELYQRKLCLRDIDQSFL